MATPGPSPQPAMPDAVKHALTDVDAVRTGMRRDGVTDREVLAALELLVSLQRQVNGTVSVLMAAAEARHAAEHTTNAPLEVMLTTSGQESVPQVRNQVFQAGILASRPRVHDAAAAGKITLSQARAIRDVVESLPGSLDEAQKEHAEQLLLVAADRLPADKLRSMTDTVLDQVAPEAKDTPEQRQIKLDLRDARAVSRRSLRFGVPTDGSIDFHGSLPAIEGTRLKNLVESIAARDYRGAKDRMDRERLAVTPDQRLADALTKVVGVASQKGDGEHGSMPSGAAQITVLIREQDLLDRATGTGRLLDGTEVSAGDLRRMLCDADVIPVVLGGRSEILDLGRTRRLASPALRHALALRDGHCAFPGCTVPIHRCELHHIAPWQRGGLTCLDNLVALCARHHQLCEPAPPEVDDDGYARPPDQWRIRMRSDGLPEFTPPEALVAATRSSQTTSRSGSVDSELVSTSASESHHPYVGAARRSMYALNLFYGLEARPREADAERGMQLVPT
jgi:Domain of unknown function (DUF222)